MTHPMHWITVTDENGVDFHALSPNPEAEGHGVDAWVFTDRASGFGDDPGRVNFKHGLQKLPDGKYGA